MPCYFPLQALYSLRPDGKKDIQFGQYNWFEKGGSKPFNGLLIPCGRCMGCRLEKSRQWALRCVHESKLYEDNCFVTLTFSEEFVPADGSLRKSHMQNFMKRLRQKFSDRRIRVFYCGEYGSNFGRPHYHLCLFNLAFSDVDFWKEINGYKHYTSEILQSLWTFGFSSIAELTYESAAYVARYSSKKVVGREAVEHYRRVDPDTGYITYLVPEFSQSSLKPGLGKGWFDKFARSDMFPRDECMARGSKCKPPRYYDVLRERVDPEGFAKAKEARLLRAESKADDGSFKRLAVKLKCQEARMNKLIRTMEK